MGPLRKSTLHKLSLICLASSLVPSTSALNFALSTAQVLGVLEQRDSSCGNDTYKTCTTVDSALPNDFCCPLDTACVSLDSSSSAICCPSGADCSAIQPIGCNLSLQNITLNPNAVIMTTRLGDNLPGCNGMCCPFGYACGVALNGDAICRVDKATSSLSGASANTTSSSTLLPSSTSSSTTSSPSSTSTSTSVSSTSAASSSTPTGNGIDSTKPLPVSLCPRFPSGAVATGFFSGLIAGVVLALLSVICLGNRRKERNSKVSSKLSSHFRGRSADGTIIGVSEPIPQNQSARTEFLRKQPERLKRTGTRVMSWFSNKGTPYSEEATSPHDKDNWKMPTPPVPNNIPLEPLGRTTPITTPERQLRTPGTHAATTLTKEPSTESIRVYTPQSTVKPPSRGQQQTPGRTADESTKMSPFKTPNKPSSTGVRNLRVEAENKGMILSPSRYEGDAATTQNLPRTEAVRPTTTFTDMLHGIGFPDPGQPATPDMPKALKTRNGKRT